MPLLQLDSGIRAISPSFDLPDGGEYQGWFADHQKYRWGQIEKITKGLVSGDFGPDEWADRFDSVLLEGHSNAWWLGRVMGGDVSDFDEDIDLIVGRGYKDAEADYLDGFLDDLHNGRYLTADGSLNAKAIAARERLYLGKMRGTVNDAFVYASAVEDQWYWRLGAVELHCLDCPEFATLFDGVSKSELFTTPGAGDTPCLGNCTCHIERVASDGKATIGVKPVTLEFWDNEAAA